MKLLPAILMGIAIAVGLTTMTLWMGSHPPGDRPAILDVTAWQSLASPGLLSSAHAFMDHNCAGCHTAVVGVDAANCISCHATETVLLSGQTTAFHKQIDSCGGCHVEHQGVEQRPIIMDHRLFSKLERDYLPDELKPVLASLTPSHSRITAEEMVLDCMQCHANQDPHRTLFGGACESCHSTSQWSLPEFRHPSAESKDCAQCHQAPPSHYMMHFQMVSETVAGIEHADVTQCFLCHQTNAWNDIKGVGWYKHH